MKPAAICTTLRLPTLVKANNPAFSLQERARKPNFHTRISRENN